MLCQCKRTKKPPMKMCKMDGVKSVQNSASACAMEGQTSTWNDSDVSLGFQFSTNIPLTSQTTLSGTSEDLVSPELDFVTSDPNGSETTAIDGEDGTMLCSKGSPGCQCFRETHLLTHPV